MDYYPEEHIEKLKWSNGGSRMMNGSIYLVVKDFDKSLDFYEKVFDKKVSATNGKRFAMFYMNGLNLCLMNGYYDEQHPEQKETMGSYYPEYDNMSDIANAANSRKVFINLGVDDLDLEYQRICDLGIGNHLTPIRYLNVFSPYWYFTFMDPDGNPIEITGARKE